MICLKPARAPSPFMTWSRVHCRLVGAAPGKQIAIAGLGVEKAEEFAELQIGIQLRVGRSIAVDGARLQVAALT